MYVASESSVALASPESNVLIIRQGRTVEKAYQMAVDESNGLEVTPCTTYLVIAPSVQAALQAIEQYLPDVWSWAVAESGVQGIPSSDHMFQVLADSWGPYRVNYIGHDGTSGQGAIAWSWAYDTLTPEHRELALQWLFENLEVQV